MPVKLSLAVAQSYDIEPRVITSLLVAGGYPMWRYLILLLLVTMAAPETGAAHQSSTYLPLPGNQFIMDSYRGYFRIVDSSQPGDLALHSAPTENSPKVLSVTSGSIATSDGTTSRGDDTTWLRVVIENKVEWTGWIRIRNLRHVQPDTFPGTELAVSGFCSGYDPLWGFSWEGPAARLDTYPGTEQLSISMATAITAGHALMFSAANNGVTVEAVFDGDACVPAQIQGLIGTSGLIVVTAGGQRRLLTGCCQARAKAFAQ